MAQTAIAKEATSLLTLTDKQRRYAARCQLGGIPEVDHALGPLVVDTRGARNFVHQIHDEYTFNRPVASAADREVVCVIYTPGGLGAVVVGIASSSGPFAVARQFYQIARACPGLRTPASAFSPGGLATPPIHPGFTRLTESAVPLCG